MQNIHDLVFLDIETNGFETGTDILEIGAVKCVYDHDRKLVEPVREYSHLIYFDGVPNQSAFAVNRLNPEELKQNGRELSGVLAELIDLSKDAILVGHNIIDFDLRILTYHINRHNLTWQNQGVVDTLRVSRDKLSLPSHTLQFLAQYFGIQNQPQHRALADVMATIEVFKKLIEIG